MQRARSYIHAYITWYTTHVHTAKYPMLSKRPVCNVLEATYMHTLHTIRTCSKISHAEQEDVVRRARSHGR
jgi:hypothetical protein